MLIAHFKNTIPNKKLKFFLFFFVCVTSYPIGVISKSTIRKQFVVTNRCDASKKKCWTSLIRKSLPIPYAQTDLEIVF